MAGCQEDEDRWRAICQRRDWYDEEQLTAIESFLRSKKLYGDLVAYTQQNEARANLGHADAEYEAWCLNSCSAAGIAVPSGLPSEAALIVEKRAPFRNFLVSNEAPFGSQSHRAWVAGLLKGCLI